MKWVIGCLIGLMLFSCSNHLASDRFSQVLSEEDFKKLFPHANEGLPFTIPDADPNFYSYSNIRKALDSKEEFSVFMSSTDDTINRLELAAILANWAQETTGGWRSAQDGYTSWGLCYYEEVGARTAASNPDPEIRESYCYYNPNSKYQPTDTPLGDTCFFGRGPIQLSWNGNYGAFSEYIYDGNEYTLLNNPDGILKDGKLAFISGFWFWTMYKGSTYIPNKTCHDVMTEKGAQGFGEVINIVNGAIECNKKLPPYNPKEPQKTPAGNKIRGRADHFYKFANYLGVGDQLPARPSGEPQDNDEWNSYYRAMLVGCILSE